jgi:hypothetical protein
MEGAPNMILNECKAKHQEHEEGTTNTKKSAKRKTYFVISVRAS